MSSAKWRHLYRNIRFILVPQCVILSARADISDSVIFILISDMQMLVQKLTYMASICCTVQTKNACTFL
jgi:hypothetical protein